MSRQGAQQNPVQQPNANSVGLEVLGVPGRQYLRESLTSCSDPLQAIEEFQVENGILLPSLRPMMPLLDLHGVKRLDFHNSVMESLREKLLSQIAELGQKEGRERDKKLKELLVKSFPVVKVKALRPVVMAVMKQMTQVDDKYLKVLVRDKELYDDCDTVVKRQMWKDNQSLFGDEVSPLLSQYIREKETLLFDQHNLTNLFFTPSPKVRRQGEVVQKLTHMIGNNVRLYDMVLQFLRTLFLRTRNVHYCTLRAELLMGLHDAEVQEITSVDPCHKFTWCIDACIREKNVDLKRSRELQGFLDGIRSGQEQVLGDLSMMLCDPYAVNFLATSSLKILHHLVGTESLPRENTILILLLRMLALGLSAWHMIDSQEFREPKLDPQVVTKFLPALMSLIVDDQVRSLNAKLPIDERESAITIIEHSGPPPDAYQAYVSDSSVACVLAMYYTLQVARNKDKTALTRVLGTLALGHEERAFEDPFLHTLVAHLIPMSEEFANETFCTVVFDEFFFTAIAKENVVRHLTKLVWYVYPKLPQHRLDTLVKALQPGPQSSESARAIYQQLVERIETHQAHSSHPESLEIDSPLINVPTPASI
nr:EOG090X0363 [Eulimnadia texana]